MIWLLVLAFCAAAATAERKSYAGYKLFHVTPKSIEEVAFLRKLESNIEYDFWTEPRGVGKQVDILVRPKDVNNLVVYLHSQNIDFTISKRSIQGQLDELWQSIDARPKTYAFDLNNWNTLEDIYTWLDALPSSCNSAVTCSTYSIGNSIEGREIKAFSIKKSGTGRRSYIVDATTHAREWLSTGTILKLLDLFVNQYGSNADVTRLVDSYDWYFIAVVNPDGYKFSWDSDRYWRKNRRNHGNCYGVDINRNFDFRWGTDGVSHLQCADTYCGATGNSEPETQAVANEYARIASTVDALLTMHSYGRMWLFPWGNYEIGQPGQQCDLADDHADLLAVSNPTADAIENTFGTQWDRGNSCEVIYAVTGATDDYAKGALAVKYAFTAELRGVDFVIPPSEIDNSFREIWNGLVELEAQISAAKK